MITVRVNPKEAGSCYGCSCFFEHRDYQRDYTRCAINCHDYQDSYTQGKTCPGPGIYRLEKIRPNANDEKDLMKYYRENS